MAAAGFFAEADICTAHQTLVSLGTDVVYAAVVGISTEQFLHDQ
jgi:hypothetical protein